VLSCRPLAYVSFILCHISSTKVVRTSYLQLSYIQLPVPYRAVLHLTSTSPSTYRTLTQAHTKLALVHTFLNIFFWRARVYIIGRLFCIFDRDVWIRIQRAAVASKRATNLAHLPYLAKSSNCTVCVFTVQRTRRLNFNFSRYGR